MASATGGPTYCALFVCFQHITCGFVWGRTAEERDQRLIERLLEIAESPRGCNCLLARQTWACIVFYQLPATPTS